MNPLLSHTLDYILTASVRQILYRLEECNHNNFFFFKEQKTKSSPSVRNQQDWNFLSKYEELKKKNTDKVCCCKSPFPLFPTQNVNGHLLQGATGHFKAIFMRHQSRDSEDSTNISLNGSSLPLMRLPKHLTITVGIKVFSAGWRRSHLPPAGAHPEVRLRKKKTKNTSSAKYLQEAFHRVSSSVLPYLPSVCVKDVWLPLTYSTLVELWRPSLGVTLVRCGVATQDKRMCLCWGK